MTQQVVSFNKVKKGAQRYLFILGAWSDHAEKDELLRKLCSALSEFGANLEDQGTAVLSTPGSFDQTFAQLYEKQWPPDVKRLLGGAIPFLLVIDTEFETFRPKTDNAAIMWLRYSEHDLTQFEDICAELAGRVKRGQNLFKFLHSQFDELPPEMRGKFPGTLQQHQRAESSLNFKIDEYEKFLSFDLAILADQTRRRPSGWRRSVRMLRHWTILAWKDQVGSKVIAWAIIGVLTALFVLFGWRFVS